METADESLQSPGGVKGKKRKESVKHVQRVMRGETSQSAALKESGALDADAVYQVNVRNPLFANSEKTSSWEMRFLARHYHPSVCSFADSVISHKFVEYDGDPLHDFSLKHFLDRFVRKKPKAQEEKEDDDNDSVNSDEFEEILRKSEKNLQGDFDDEEWGDLTDEELDGDELDDDLFEDEDMEDLFDSDDDLSEGGFSDEFGDDEELHGTDSLFVPAEDVDEDEDDNFVIRKKDAGIGNEKVKRGKKKAKLPIGKRLKRS